MSSDQIVAHTPAPWKWGDGWEEIKTNRIDPEEEYSGPKYADLSLEGPRGEPILPLRIDHYEVIWDSENDVYDLSDADRALIAASPRLLAACKETLHRLGRINMADGIIADVLRAAIAEATQVTP